MFADPNVMRTMIATVCWRICNFPDDTIFNDTVCNPVAMFCKVLADLQVLYVWSYSEGQRKIC